ncbi:MAG TPA: ABC transporter permease, partial [Candidatus Saccharimonadales bacterium]|nr:ABC transporter permease [Candidatus Saccharimonadales bacterium]
MPGLLQDVRFALRQLRKSPAFTFTSAVMLTVAICSNSTVFSWISGTMLHPIPGARNTGELVSVMRGHWSPSPPPPLSYLDYRDLRERNHSFDGMLAYHHDWLALTDGARPERIYVANVSANFFSVLGIQPLLGRFFLPQEETRLDAVPMVVLSYSTWQTRYSGDPSIVGKSLEIARHPVTIIGVAPKGFTGAMPGIREDVWTTLNPIGTSQWQMTHRDANWLNVLARLRPGITRTSATLDLETLMQGIVAAYPKEHLGVNTITLDPMWRSPFGANGYMAASLPVLLAIAAVVLLLTCANVATLTLVRFVARRREMATRLSLGASRGHLMRQMLLEGAILSGGAGLAALLLTSQTASTFERFIPASSNPIAINGAMDSTVVAAIVLLAAITSILCGAFPAWRASRVPPVEVLKEESSSVGGGSHSRRLLSGMVVSQIALSLALLVCSALLLRTLRNIAEADPGFEQDHVLTASVGLNMAGYSNSEAQVIRRKVLERAAALPGVTAASLTDWLPMSFNRKTADAFPEGYVPQPHESGEVRRADVSPDYFRTLAIPILQGRAFTQDDIQKAPPVIVVDQTAAARYWPGQDPIGRRLHIWGTAFRVVGVAANTKHQFMNESPEPMVYMSYFQRPDNETIVQVRTQGNPANLAPAFEQAIHSVDARPPVFDVRPLRETTQMGAIFAVVQSTFAAMFAFVALVLAATGIYGVVAYRTQLRTHEIGVRMALGASRRNVLVLVLQQGLWLTGGGILLGVALSLALNRFIVRALYGVGANDPATLAAVVAVLACVALLACYIPALRAVRKNPVA